MLINERTHNNRQRNYFSKKFYSKAHKLILKSNSRNTNLAGGSVHASEIGWAHGKKYRVSQKFVRLISCTITFNQNFIFTWNCFKMLISLSSTCIQNFSNWHHSDNHMLLIRFNKLKNGSDSFRKAHEAHLIHKAMTLEPLGINKRDELWLYIVYLLIFCYLVFFK